MKEKLVGIVVIVALLYYGVQWLKSWKVPEQQTLSGYTTGLQRSQGKALTAMTDHNVQQLTNAVWKFKADKERFPNSLQELVESGLVDHIPAGFNYDPVTGAVTPLVMDVAPAPAVP